MTAAQREALREAADTLVLAPACDDGIRHALAEARAILLSVRTSVSEPWIEQLADDLEDTGPTPASESPPTGSDRSHLAWPRLDRPLWR